MMTFNIRRIKKMLPKTNLLVIHHHSNYLNNNGIRRIIHRYFEKRVLTAANELIIPNEYVVQQVKQDFGVNKIAFLPSSFEKKQYKISKLDSNIILFVGNIEYRKGLVYGLQVFKQIHENYPEIEYHIAGKYNENDSYYQQLKAYVEKNNLINSVIFEGRVSDERLNWLYENSKLFLFPSLLEGYGWVMIEAMGRGVPVVAFNNSAMPYTVKDGENGLLIENKNIAEMAQRTCVALSDSSFLHRLQEGALRTYEKVPSQEALNSLTEKYLKSWRVDRGE